MKGRFWVLSATFALYLLGCGGGDSDSSDGSEIDCNAETSVGYDLVRAFDVCTNCHSTAHEGLDRNGAPTSLNFNTYEGAVDAAPRMVAQVSMGNMPPPGSGFSLTAEEKDELYVWVECGTPE
jgi:uncharacterized membrane protein